MEFVSQILLKQGDEFLLQHRDDIPGIVYPDMYALWGGAVEAGEDGLTAAVRELEEELGLQADKGSLSLLYEYEVNGIMPQTKDKVFHIYLYLLEIEGGIKLECHEGQGIKRVRSRDEVPPNKIADPAIEAFRIYEKGRLQ